MLSILFLMTGRCFDRAFFILGDKMITTLNITRGDKEFHNDYEVVRETHCDSCGHHISTRWNAYCNELETILDEKCFTYFNQSNGGDLWYTFCSEKCRGEFLIIGDRRHMHCFPEKYAEEEERQKAVRMRHDETWSRDMKEAGFWPHEKKVYSAKWTEPNFGKLTTSMKLKWFLRRRR